MLATTIIEAFSACLGAAIGILVIAAMLHAFGWMVAKIRKVFQKDKTPATISDAKGVLEKKVSWLTVVIVLVVAYVLFMLILALGTK